MNILTHKLTNFSLTLLAGLLSAQAFTQVTDINTIREQIVIYSRNSDEALNESIIRLQTLYRQTKDLRVRDDLIALLVRQRSYHQALILAKSQSLNSFTESELENLGLAARSEKDFSASLVFYQTLTKKYPSNPNGLLGYALVSLETGKFEQTQLLLNQFKNRFGNTESYQELHHRLLDHTEPDIAKLGRWQKELKNNPENKQLAINLYRLAARYNIYPLQEKITQQYPDLFSKNDHHWLQQAQAVNLVRNNQQNKINFEQAYEKLSQLINETKADSDIYQQALQDRLIVASNLNHPEKVLQDYQLLLDTQKPIPSYVQIEYADNLLKLGSPYKAKAVYQTLAEKELNNNGKISTVLLFKLAQVSSDMNDFTEAKHYLEQIDEPLLVNDFTHTHRILNPNYERKFMAQINVENWQGNKDKAIQILENRLNTTPADPWIILALAEVKRDQLHYDDVNNLLKEAQIFFVPKDYLQINKIKAHIALDQNDWQTASNIIENIDVIEKDKYTDLLERYNNMRSWNFMASFSNQNKTYPKENTKNEITQEYYLYSPKSTSGNDLYLHYLANNSPLIGQNLKQQRIGIGSNLNFYPLRITTEIGKGIKLNNKHYFSINTGYRINQYLDIGLYGNINGSDTPLRAINQNIYTKDIGLFINYIHSNLLDISGNYNLMKFDDHNLRRTTYITANLESIHYNRWKLINNFRVDYQKNKKIDSAHYYNPEYAYSIETGFDLSYTQPLNYGLKFTHHLKANIGQYNQKLEDKENTWAISYGQNWQIKQNSLISYEFGRKKNIYDGDTEYNNFLNVNLSFSF